MPTERKKRRTELETAFQPQTQKQREAISQAVSLVPETITAPDLTPSPTLDIQAPQELVFADITRLEAEATQLPETPAITATDKVLERIFEIQPELRGEEQFRVTQREEVGLPELRTTEEDLVSQIKSFQLKAQDLANQQRLVEERVQQESIGRGRTVGGVAPITAGRRRELALQQADITSQALTAAATLSAVQGRIVTATRQVEEAVTTKFGALKAEKDALIENIQLLKDSGILDREDQKLADAQQARQEQLKRELDIQEQNEMEVKQFALSVAPQLSKQAGGSQKIDQLFNARNVQEATQLASQFGVLQPEITREEQLREQLLEAQIGRTQADTARIIKETSGVSTQVASEFANIIGSVASSVSAELGAKRGEEVKANLTQAINSGDYSTAYNQIADAVEATLSGENETRFESSRIDFQVMAGLRDSINTYAEAGGDMGLLTGKAEDIERKLLGITTDPDASALAVQLLREFQTYRNIMTGAAFTPAESRDYAAVNPTLGKSLDLNLAVIDGALAQLENRITSTVNSKISGAGDIYNLANPDGLNSLDADYELYLQMVGGSDSINLTQ